MSESSGTASKAGPASDSSGEVGKGALYLSLTKMWFIVSGYGLMFGLPRILGDGDEGKALYGKFGVVNAFSAVVNALVVQGTMQAVSRFIGRDPSQAGAVRRAALKLQAILGGGLFVVLLAAAPLIADLYDDADLVTPLRCAAFILLFYSFYSVYLGNLNGRKLFVRQAMADFSYSTMKLVGVLLGALVLKSSLGGVAGAFAGFAAAAAGVLLLARFLSGRAPEGGSLSVRELFNFQVFTMAYTGVATAALRGDIQVLKLAMSSHADVDKLAGDYTAAQQFASIPYQAVFAITLVLFPLVSAEAGRDAARMRLYVRQTTRYAAIIASLLVALFVACPERTIRLLYTPDYLSASSILRPLALGYLAYSVFFIACSILTASGRPVTSLCLVAGVLVAEILAAWALVGPAAGTGVAAGTALAMVLGLLAADRVLKKSFGQGLQWGMQARIVGGAALVGLAGNLLSAHHSLLGRPGLIAGLGGTGLVAKMVTVLVFGVLSLVYLALLARLGVFDQEDKDRFGKILARLGIHS